MSCLTSGTLIATPSGERRVETLRTGDPVITRDDGIRPVVWVGSRTLSWQDLTVRRHLRPVLIRKGSLGQGLPERDMQVSPNQRLLTQTERSALHFDADEAFVAAKHLVSGHRVMEVDSAGVTYVQVMFDRHRTVMGDGLWSERFNPVDRSLGGIGNAQRNELLELFPDLRPEPQPGPAPSGGARKRTDASALVA